MAQGQSICFAHRRPRGHSQHLQLKGPGISRCERPLPAHPEEARAALRARGLAQHKPLLHVLERQSQGGHSSSRRQPAPPATTLSCGILPCLICPRASQGCCLPRALCCTARYSVTMRRLPSALERAEGTSLLPGAGKQQASQACLPPSPFSSPGTPPPSKVPEGFQINCGKRQQPPASGASGSTPFTDTSRRTGVVPARHSA